MTSVTCDLCGTVDEDTLLACPECRTGAKRVRALIQALFTLRETALSIAFTDKGTCKECGCLADEPHKPSCGYGAADRKAVELTDE